MTLTQRLFRRRSIHELHAEGERSGLKRALGPVSLVALGVGAIIGAGIFGTIGQAAAKAGPAVSMSFVVTAVACAFAGLCYAELTSVVPIAGSAYTYAYATLGQLVAWIIGWDLILEYAVGKWGSRSRGPTTPTPSSTTSGCRSPSGSRRTHAT
jgi:APA family basic amino acid/polyamine antiporter